MDENMKKWPQTETESQTGAFTLPPTIINLISKIYFGVWKCFEFINKKYKFIFKLII